MTHIGSAAARAERKATVMRLHGQKLTYSQIAARVGVSAREVGRIVAENRTTPAPVRRSAAETEARIRQLRDAGVSAVAVAKDLGVTLRHVRKVLARLDSLESACK